MSKSKDKPKADKPKADKPKADKPKKKSANTFVPPPSIQGPVAAFTAPVAPAHAAAQSPPPADATDVGERVSTNIRALRKARGLSLEALSQASGVSRAALSQIETGKSNPSIGAVWKIATGLGVPFGELLGETGGGVQLLRRAEMPVLRSTDATFESRALLRAGALAPVEAYELRLAKGARHAADAHAPGTRELVVVLSGRLSLVVGPATYDLEPGDAIVFSADVPHAYENTGPGETHAHNVLVYSR
jgi:transcriptional regulator with XRE-family HTH domain